ncbi:PHD and RING finger domain-containing protein 1 isoform X2 [Cylas formicarius]|uniref:PHD and RING finger domain-containing protein 1 isoform X2 n=1 Tax=Cylas formicarius TaxID=197179 RepID=UPI0029587260|nr:PHD and RING finger domain-containing protein 1 isoform X2 [Cylas formicarius]
MRKMSSDDSQENSRQRKRKVRRVVDDSPASTSSGSPVFGSSSGGRRRRVLVLQEESSDSDSDNSILLRVTSDSDGSSSSGSTLFRKVKSTAPLTDSGSENSSFQWDSDSSEVNNERTDSQKAVLSVKEEKSLDSDSSDGQSEKCPICLISFRNQEVGVPENCEHMFCLECIQEWSKNMNTCPVDRQEYTSISVKRNINGNILRKIDVEKPQNQSVMDIVEDPTFCEICGSDDNEDRLLLCDGCDLGFHLYCLTPALTDVPEGIWYCNDCITLDRPLSDIDPDEVIGLWDDAEMMLNRDGWNTSQRLRSLRLVPRTTQTERVRRRIANNRTRRRRNETPAAANDDEHQQPSTSSGVVADDRVSSTSGKKTKKRSARQRRKRRSARKPTYRTVYEIDSVTGEAVPVKKRVRSKKYKKYKRNKAMKSTRTRLVDQLRACAPRRLPNAPENLSDIRHRAGIARLDIFGHANRLDYFSDSENDDVEVERGILLSRRAVVDATRRRGRLKAAAVADVVVSSTTDDVLGSIMETQERFHSKNAIMSVLDSSGKLQIDRRKRESNNNNIVNGNNSYAVRQTPTSYGRNETNSNADWSGSGGYEPAGTREYHGTYSSYSTETVGGNSGAYGGGGGDENDVPQDYTQRTLCEAADADKDRYTPGSKSPVSDADLDIYSDIEGEAVSTSKSDECKPATATTPNETSGGGRPYTPSNVPYSPNASTYSPSAVYSPTRAYTPSNVPYSPSTTAEESETDMVIDTEKVQEEQHRDETAVTSTVNSAQKDEQDAPPGCAEEKPGDSAKQDDDDESNDGCPNFSIYSKQSKSVALTTDLALQQQQQSTQIDASVKAPISSDSAVQVFTSSNIISGLYSDSEDESVVKKTSGAFEIADIKDMTEDIVSEEERTYTPCRDERDDKDAGFDGLDTEMISEDERNEFDESREMKMISDGDALEINAKESEIEFTRPEDYEEGEIVDKSKEKAKKDDGAENVTEKETPKKDKDGGKKRKKTKEKPAGGDQEKGGNKENENRESFKKISKNNKERNYRDKDRGRSRSKSPKTQKQKDKDEQRKKEKRKELERYNVRALIADKPRLPPKDKFGRDIRRSPSKSRSRSYTPPPREKPVSPPATPRRRSVSPVRRHSASPEKTSRRRRSSSRRRSVSRGRRAEKTRKSKTRRSASRSEPRKRNKSKSKKRRRSTSKSKKTRDSRRTKKRATSRNRRRSNSRSATPQLRQREWTPSFSKSPSPAAIRHASPSWTPPKDLENAAQPMRSQNLTVILNNSGNGRPPKNKREKRRKEKRRDGSAKRRRRERERTPPPSKEVFASGDNILVSVSFNNENETRDITTREKKKKDSEELRKKKEKRKSKNKDLAGVKPVAIIDLERSPFQEIISSPKDVIVLSDSDHNDVEINNLGNDACDSSQQVASPERIPVYATGPKTPPEPQVKFSLTSKTSQLRAISNPLHEPDDNLEDEVQEEIANTMHKGPNTPPEPPTSPPSSPDAYDPFEPTKSRSVTPEPAQTVQSITEDDGREDNMDSRSNIDMEKGDQMADMKKVTTPPIADIQPADSQSSIPTTPERKSPEQRLVGTVIVQGIQTSVSITKPVAQTTPFSSVPSSIITSAPVSSNITAQRINILNSTLIGPSHNVSAIPQRIVLPNQVKSSPVKISPTKAAVKSTPIKPLQSKTGAKKKRSVNGSGGIEDGGTVDLDSPYSPASSDYEDLFEPPPETVPKSVKPASKPKPPPQKHQSVFDTLFGSPPYKKKMVDKKIGKKTALTPTKTKHVGIKIDEDSLKILEELPNSAVEMQVKDKFLKKLNRQERVVEEVKLVLKPFYNKKKINKEEYKDIMRRAVPKICHNKSGEINPIKIRKLIEAYVKKITHSKKVTSSSSLPQKV